MRFVVETDDATGIADCSMIDINGEATTDRLKAKAVVVDLDGTPLYSEDLEPEFVHTVH